MSRAGQVAVYTASPVAPGETWSRLEALLSPDEEARLARFRVETGRSLYLSAHALLRLALTETYPVPPDAWRFDADPLGKPRVCRPHLDRPLHFSLTHTDGLVACAIALEPEVGIDAESLSRQGRFEDLAARFYAPDERRLLAATPTPERHRETFLDLWTLKESYLKARGLGLSVPTSAVSFTPDDSGSATVTFSAPIEDVPGSWRFVRVHLPEHRLAVALRAPSLTLHTRDGNALLASTNPLAF